MFATFDHGYTRSIGIAMSTEVVAETKAHPYRVIVIVAALGYFVDIYDLLLFNVIRLSSLASLGYTGDAAKAQGFFLLNMQMGGMLVGGLLWGILADKRGRLSVLFGSIILYSLANIANGFVNSVETYAAMRFIAGIGLAGELGAGITLVSESMHRESRGYGTTIVASIGLCGAIVAALVGDMFHWRTAYFIGGGMGLLLLVLRIGVYESGMFDKVKQQTSIVRGNFFQFFSNRHRGFKYLAVIMIGVPIWYVLAILIAFSPEMGKAMGMTSLPVPSRAVLYCYIGMATGDLASGSLSQALQSRKKALAVFFAISIVAIGAYFTFARTSLNTFYLVCMALGFAIGYWAVFMMVASEQFGTNLRGTATTTVPNFVRGSVVLVTSLFRALESSLGTLQSAAFVGAVLMMLAIVALRIVEETYGKDLDFVEGV